MRALVSGVGTRGDVQPVLALAVALRDQGHEVSLCVPPNFMEWAANLGFTATPVGVEMRHPTRASAPSRTLPARTGDLVGDLVADQFAQLGLAAEGCEVVVGAGAHQFAARSIAERAGVPYVNAVYAAVSIPSADLAPPASPGEVWAAGERADNLRRWEADSRSWNERFLGRINENREALGLLPVDDVHRHIFGERPLLAADPILGPAPDALGMTIVPTGAWLLADSTPLSAELEAFLKDGEPPIYVGFGSMPAPRSMSRTVLDAARKVGRRVILSHGWADFEPLGDAPDCLMIGDVNQQALFPRVAAVVHHGGAGTTTAAARAGAAQVITPMFSDQFYWALRVRELGIGSSATSQGLSAEGLAAALAVALAPAVADRARRIAEQVATDGAAVAAREIVGRRG